MNSSFCIFNIDIFLGCVLKVEVEFVCFVAIVGIELEGLSELKVLVGVYMDFTVVFLVLNQIVF